MDGLLQEDNGIRLVDDHNEHWAEVRIIRAVEGAMGGVSSPVSDIHA